MFEIEELVVQLEDGGDEGARERARALVRAVLDLHAAALTRIVVELRRDGNDERLAELARDEAVACVLSLHGLYEAEPDTGVSDASRQTSAASGQTSDTSRESKTDATLASSPDATSDSKRDPTLEGFVPVERLLAHRSASKAREERDQCDLCSAPIADRHDHLVDPQSRELRCACMPCASLFGLTKDGRWKRVRSRADRLDAFELGDDAWGALGIPIDLAFFFRSSRDQRVVAMYPSPAGATESLLSLDAWARIEAENPILFELEPDVEALLVRRGRGHREHYRVSIDACYALVGRIRANWHGFGGGTEVWAQIGTFFDELKSATVAAPTTASPTAPTPRTAHA